MIEERGGVLLDQRVERVGDVVAAVMRGMSPARAGLGANQQRVEIEIVELLRAAAHLVQKIGAADHVLELAHAERGQYLTHVLGDEAEEVDDLLRRAAELRAQRLVLRADADGAGIRMALAHHDAAHRDERGSADAELLGTQHGGHHDVASGADAAVGAQGHAMAKIVQCKDLIGFRQPHLPRHAGVFDRGLRRSAVPPLWPEIRITSALALATPAAMVPMPVTATSFTQTRASGLICLRS